MSNPIRYFGHTDLINDESLVIQWERDTFDSTQDKVYRSRHNTRSNSSGEAHVRCEYRLCKIFCCFPPNCNVRQSHQLDTNSMEEKKKVRN